MNKEKWIILMKKADFNAVSQKFHISPILARLIRNRELVTDEEISGFLYGETDSLIDPMLMKDMDRAVEIIWKKIDENKKLRIIGDYDIDGVNSVYILMKGLGACGASVDYDIPDRLRDGYGINISLIDRAIEDEIDTIITCDNGITAFDAISYAKEKGLTVIVTDHHSLAFAEGDAGKETRTYRLPEADAVINPHRSDCEYPYKELCGAAVAWKLVCALYRHEEMPGEMAMEFIENVAFATVGDVVELTGENRIIVKEGLKNLDVTPNPGLSVLKELCEIEGNVSAHHLGFVLGPCINAGGRLDTAKKAIDLLLTPDRDEAYKLAKYLKELNDSRKEMTVKGFESAVDMIEREASERGLDKVIVIYLPDCHESLAGIIAGRLKERYYRPCIVLTDAENMDPKGEDEDGNAIGGIRYIKGSGRSIEGYSMFEELSRHSELLERFGGHPMAAGMTLKLENLEALRKSLNATAPLEDEDMIPRVEIDMELPFYYATEELFHEMELLEPYGKGNRKPLFALRNVEILEVRIFGQNRNVIRMNLKDGNGNVMEAIYFGTGEEFVPGGHMNISYYLKLNEYRGRTTVQAHIQNYKML